MISPKGFLSMLQQCITGYRDSYGLKQDSHTKFGFTILELVPVLLIISVLGATVITLGSKWVESEEDTATKRRIETVEIALAKYRKLNGRLPCPAQMDLDDDDSDYGKGAESPSSDENEACITGTPTASLIPGTWVVMGTVPTKALGLSDNMMKDSWGNLMLYMVDQRMTLEDSLLKYPPGNAYIGDVRILDSQRQMRTDKAVYALLSFGENANGALQPGNERLNINTTNALEQENNHLDATGTASAWDHELVQAIMVEGFDDVVRFKGRSQLDDETASGNPLDCDETVQWDSCSANIQFEHDNAGLVNGANGGSAWASCYDGVIELTDTTCPASEEAPCDAGEAVAWGGDCASTLPNTLLSGWKVALTNTDGTANYNGGATATCTDGVISTSNISCVAPCNISDIPATDSWDGCSETERVITGATSHAVVQIRDTNSGDGNSGDRIYECVGGTYTATSSTCSDSAVCEGTRVPWTVVDGGNEYKCEGLSASLEDTEQEVITNDISNRIGEALAICEEGSRNLPDGNKICEVGCVATSVQWDANGETCTGTIANMRHGDTSQFVEGLFGSAYFTCDNGQFVHDDSQPASCFPTSGGGVCLPLPIPTQITSNVGHITCGIGQDTKAYCWGNNGQGGVGDGTTTNRDEPTEVIVPSGATRFTALWSNHMHTCGNGDNETTYCWGWNMDGQLGDGTTVNKTTPTPVSTPSGVEYFINISGGFGHTCGIGNDYQTYCWGRNDQGQLGDGTTVNKTTPTLVSMPSGVDYFSAIEVGFSTSCALGNDNKLYCWGQNDDGQIGDSSTTDRTTPTAVSLPSGVTAFTDFDTGSNFTCAQGNNNDLYCWGRNDHGQLGIGSLYPQTTPTSVLMPSGVTTFTRFDTGTSHVCAIGDDNTTYCWGDNTSGQLGNGSTTDDPYPSEVTLPAGVNEFTFLVTGNHYSCGVGDDGKSYCWGQGTFGKLGTGSTASRTTPRAVVDTNYTPTTEEAPANICGECVPTGAETAEIPFTIIATSYDHNCGVTDDDKVYCWGRNDYGQLGIGSTTDQSSPTEITLPSGVTTFTQFGLGYDHTCGLADDNKIYCWGRNAFGQLGNGGSPTSTTPVAVTLPSGVTSFTEVAASHSHNCAIGNNNRTYCWGANTFGQLGEDSFTNRTTPTLVTMPDGVSIINQLALGFRHTCGVGDDNKTYCWGYNADYQVGDGTTENKTKPTPVTMPSGVSYISQLSVGDYHSCGIGNNNTLYCWGSNAEGQLGDGVLESASTPNAVHKPSGVSHFTSFSAGYKHNCAVGNNNQTYCWGLNGYGQIGDGTTTNRPALTAVTMPSGVSYFSQTMGGRRHSCGISNNNKLYCWGGNSYGQLGDGATADSGTPVPVDTPTLITKAAVTCPIELDDSCSLVPTMTKISVGAYHSCGIDNDGTAWCWGRGTGGAIGNGSIADAGVPTEVNKPSGVSSYQKIVASFGFTCAHADNNQIYCWGAGGNGRLGNGTTTDRHVPTQVTLPSGVSSFTELASAGMNRFMCAVGDNNKTYCWGHNDEGQLGDGTTTDRHTPVEVTMPSGVNVLTNLAIGYDSGCGTGDDGNLYCWGDNSVGQLGNGSTGAASTAVAVTMPSGVTSMTEVSVNNAFACATGDDGKAYCWGNNQYHQLGDGYTTNRTTPTAVTIPSDEDNVLKNIRAGVLTTCGIGTDDGKGYCWGYGTYGQMGNGSAASNSYPSEVSTPSGSAGFIAIESGYQHTCGITDNHKVYCWGYNDYYQFGKGSSGGNTATPQPTDDSSFTPNNEPIEGEIVCSTDEDVELACYAPADEYFPIAVGLNFTCGIHENGKAYCWGNNTYGQLGIGSGYPQTSPTAVLMPSGVNAFTNLVAGQYHACAVGDDNKPYCWGYNNDGELGDGSTTNRDQPVAVSLPSGVTSINNLSAGGFKTCGIGDNNVAYCWGGNNHGQIGDGTTTNRTTPTAVSLPSGVTAFTQIKSLYWNTCGLGDNNQSYCWGHNWYRQVGDGASGTQRTSPALVSMPSGVNYIKDFVGGRDHTCGMGDNGKAYCWGGNTYGQIGDGTTSSRSTPYEVSLPSGVTSLSSLKSAGFTNCAFGSDNKTYCWGANNYGQIGDGTTTNQSTPTAVTPPSGGSSFEFISVGTVNTCGMGDDGNAYCWGGNTDGQIGDGTTTQHTTPATVNTATGYTPLGPEIECPECLAENVPNAPLARGDGSWTCALNSSGNAYCWGRNFSGLGDGSSTTSTTPLAATMPADVTFTHLTMYDDRTACAIGTDGNGYCWGSGNSGGLGNGDELDRMQPTMMSMPAGVTFTDIDMGSSFACAVGDNGKVYCWGQNDYSQLGDGTTTDSSTPLAAPFPSGVTSYTDVTTGFNHVCALGNDSKAYCWGQNNYGQLGDNSTTDRTAPTEVITPSGVSGFTRIMSSGRVTCALGDNEKAYCWGRNDQGQLGIGSTLDRVIPSEITLPSAVDHFIEISPGAEFGCGLGNNRKVYCWGLNDNGQLGNNDTTNSEVPVETAMPALTMTLSTPAPGCALGMDQQIYCWGENTYGQVGDGTTSNALTPVTVSGLTSNFSPLPACAVDGEECEAIEGSFISGGLESTCAIGNDGKIYCWGSDTYTQLGNGSDGASATPDALTLPMGVTRFTHISVGNIHACAIGDNGTGYCWGDGYNGKVGDGNGFNNPRPSPVEVQMPTSTFVSIGAGNSHSCGLGGDGYAYCWGSDDDGQLGFGHGSDIYEPYQVTPPSNNGAMFAETFSELAVGGNHNCAIGAEDGRVYCWGMYPGTGDVMNNAPDAISLPSGVTSMSQLAAGQWHTCGIGNNEQTYCWGRRLYGVLGDGGSTTGNQTLPIAVSMPSGVSQITNLHLGTDHTCGIGDDGNGYCWGRRQYGAIGNGGATTGQETSPVAVTMPSGVTFTHMGGGDYHTCAIGSDEQTYCWGRNQSAQLGDTTSTDRTIPTLVNTGEGYIAAETSTCEEEEEESGAACGNIAVSAETMHSCKLDSDGNAWCWGTNEFGQFGNNTTTNSETPVATTMPEGVAFTKIDTGTSYTCALGDDNNGYCWGSNYRGKLGDGTTTQRNTPVVITKPSGVNGFTDISSAGNHTCAVGDDGNGYCWGDGIGGKLGNGSTSQKHIPTLVSMPSGTDFTSISAGGGHTCALAENKLAYCWGNGLKGQLGNLTESIETTPVMVEVCSGSGPFSVCGAGNFKAITTGGTHSCGITNTDKPYCWGENTAGQLGTGNTTDTNGGYAVLLPSGVTSFTDIQANDYHSCGIGDNSKIYCWGRNSNGQSGDGTTTSPHTSAVETVLPSGVTGFTALTVGRTHTCAIGDDEQVYCWGKNDDNEFGDGTTTNSNTPVPSTPTGSCSGSDCEANYPIIAAGGFHNCAIGNDNKTYCWGWNNSGSVGDGTTTQRSTPTEVTLPGGISQFTVVKTGDAHSCAIADTGDAYCWGSNSGGRLGNGVSSGSSSMPVAVTMPGSISFTDLGLGNEHSCALGDDGNAYCWGVGGNGRLGNGTTSSSSTPVAVSMPASVSFVDLEAGATHNCALGDNDKIYCWGFGGNGEVGDGAGTNRNIPTEVSMPSGVNGFSQISSMSTHNCALGDDDLAYCWGSNMYGNIDDSGNFQILQPSALDLPSGVSGFRTVAAGGMHTCAVGDNNKTYCLGINYAGMLGDGTTTDHNTPEEVTMPSGVTRFVSLNLGFGHSCAIGDDTQAYCWGENARAAVGDNTTTNRLVPTLVNTGEGYAPAEFSICGEDGEGGGGEEEDSCPIEAMAIIDGGADYSCAIGDSSSYCWGSDSYKQLGNGSAGTSSVPDEISMPSGVNFTHLSVGESHACAIGDNGTAYCWGDGYYGKVGDGNSFNNPRQSPVEVVVSMDSNPFTNFIDIGAGAIHSCGLVDTGDVYCWGLDDYGNLGNSDAWDTVAVEAALTDELPSGNPAVELAIGGFHSCVVDSDGQPYCWGLNDYGQLGDGSVTDQNTPTEVYLDGISSLTNLTAGDTHTCGIADDGVAYCWGRNSYGQLGIGSTVSQQDPQAIALPSGVSAFIALTAGTQHTCGIADTGDAYCWGRRSYGRIGNGGSTSGNSTTPVAVTMPASVSFVAIGAGSYHTCALGTDNNSYCWGRNNTNQVGDGTPVDRHTPTAVSTGDGYSYTVPESCGGGDGAIM